CLEPLPGAQDLHTGGPRGVSGVWQDRHAPAGDRLRGHAHRPIDLGTRRSGDAVAEVEAQTRSVALRVLTNGNAGTGERGNVTKPSNGQCRVPVFPRSRVPVFWSVRPASVSFACNSLFR